jgi:flagellin
MNMLTGRFGNPNQGGVVPDSMFFQVGPNMDQRKQVFIGTMTAAALHIGGISISTPDKANQAIGSVDAAMTRISKQRADLGAYQNRFEMAAKGVAVAAENMQAAESLIRDTDIAAQMVNYTKNQILMQSSTAMLAQANLKPRSVLTLLQ